ncbi:MAG: SusD/RagB family nutrient-binding outer membrane lipoprotein [Mariniphaga sp.]|nr:SusD/RagB family nutrient-binding outer membrane lipoprotein [Mariniphaga sp.]
MKKIILILISTLFIISACNKTEFENAYTDPSKISATTVEKQFTGFMQANVTWVVPDYWDYFVVRRITSNRYTQAVGWVNVNAQYRPGAAAIQDRWNNFYGFLSQYRELENIYNNSSAEEQALKRIYMIAAKIYFYDHTQRVVDLHGAIPWSKAGMMSANGGNYNMSYPEYDSAESIYTTMLDELKALSAELNTISINPGIQVGFNTQDIVNKGNIDKWKRYCNSLRLRMLTRVSGAAAFQARAATERAEILANPDNYISENNFNVQINVHDLSTPIHSRNFRTGLEDWNGNLASKVMIDHMLQNNDPRLRVMFEPGENAEGVYLGLDPLALAAEQEALIQAGTISLYNRSTFSRNEFFPGVLMNASETNFIAAETFLAAGNDAAAKAAYEKGVASSINFYFQVRTISNDNTVPAPEEVTEAEIDTYLADSGISWDSAPNSAAKLNLIATQKWINFNVIQSQDSWAEYRRLKLPVLNFWTDNTDTQTQPPARWLYAGSEQIYNTENYDIVRSQDNLNTKLFWDVK